MRRRPTLLLWAHSSQEKNISFGRHINVVRMILALRLPVQPIAAIVATIFALDYVQNFLEAIRRHHRSKVEASATCEVASTMPCGALHADFCGLEELKTFHMATLRYCGINGQPLRMSCWVVAVPVLGLCQLVYTFTAAHINSFASLNCSAMVDCNNAPRLKISPRGSP